MEEVSKWHGVEADWIDLVHYPSLLLLRFFPCLEY